MQRLQKILAQKADPKVPEWLSYGNSRKVTQKPHFLNKCKGGTKENFSKIAQKVALPSKTQQHSGANGIILKLVFNYSAKTGKDFGAKHGSKRAPIGKLWQFRQAHPKPAFFEKVRRGDQKTFFKNHPKSSPHLKGPTALWPKWHYRVINMQLKCKDWRTFWRKQRL